MLSGCETEDEHEGTKKGILNEFNGDGYPGGCKEEKLMNEV